MAKILYDPTKPESADNRPPPPAAPPPQGPDVVTDTAKGVGSGVVRGVVGLPGILGDLQSVGERGAVWLRRKLAGDAEAEALRQSQERSHETAAGWRPPTSEDVITAAQPYDPSGALAFKPQTKAGQFGQVVGEFVGGALPTAGAGVWLKAGTKAEKAAALVKELVAQGVAPGVASEAAGQVADKYLGEDWGTAVRMATGTAASLGGSLAHNVTGPPANVEVPGQGTVRSTAAANVGRGISDAGGPQAVAGQLDQVGEGARLADATPQLRGQTEQLYIEPGRAQQTVREFLNERTANLRGSQDTALTRALDSVISPRSANFAEESAAMREARRARGRDLYGQVERRLGDTPIPQDRAIAYIDTLIPDDVRNGVSAPLPEHQQLLQLRGYFEGNRSFRELDQLKDILQARIDKEIKAGGTARELIDIKQQLNNSLEDATRRADGTSIYGEAQRAYKEDSGILEAHSRGRDFIKRNESPDEFALRWRDMSDTERQAERLGLRESIAATMDMAVNDFNKGSNVLRTNANTTKLNTILGEQEAGRLLNILDGLRRQRGTVQGIESQSATAGRTRGREMIQDPTQPPELPEISRVQTGVGVASAGSEWALKKILDRRHRVASEASNLDQANILVRDFSSMTPEDRLAALQRMQEIYETKDVRGVSPTLLALQAAYQAERSNDAPSFTVRPRKREGR